MIYVTCLYLLLASPSHSTREYATRELHHRVQGWPHLYGEQVQRWSRSTPSPERRHRLVRPLVSYRSYLAANYTPKGIPVWPCCDMLPDRDGLRDRNEGSYWRGAALSAGFIPHLYHVEYDANGVARVEGGTEPMPRDADSGPYWYSWRKSTEYMARQMIRNGAEPESVNKILQEMWRIELECESDCSGRRHTLESWTVWEGGYPLPR